MRINDQLKECVAFLYSEKDYPVGTGFFVSMPLGKYPSGGFSYLVTAAHVARQLGERFSIRLNSRSGKLIKSLGINAKWTFHPTDPLADVAVVPWPADDRQPFKPLFVGRDMFVTEEIVKSDNIGPCDPVLVVGLFVHVPGTHRILPIVHSGSIAMMPNEPIDTAEGPLDAWLIEARTIPGISGSPVFVYPTEGPGKSRLLGLVHGYWGERGISVGVSIVIRASKIAETLDHPDLTERRRKEEELE